jgi:hypothetical protein
MQAAQTLRIALCFLCCLLPALLSVGCASKSGATASVSVRPAPVINLPAKTPFRQFDCVQLKGVEFDTSLKGAEKAAVLARQLDEALLYALRPLLGRVTPVPAGGDFPPAPERTLQISPRIEKVRLVTPAERYWFTWGAGDTEILVRVAYREAKTGDLVAEALFYRKADLFTASWSGGTADVEARENIVGDIADYTRANR